MDQEQHCQILIDRCRVSSDFNNLKILFEFSDRPPTGLRAEGLGVDSIAHWETCKQTHSRFTGMTESVQQLADVVLEKYLFVRLEKLDDFHIIQSIAADQTKIQRISGSVDGNALEAIAVSVVLSG